MDETHRIALYARVSSQRQADESTITSQVAGLQQRITTDQFALDPEMRFLDEGFSGATLQRPALERLRDLIYAGGVDRLYVHSPDRLARNYIHQALLLEEFQKRQVTVVFINQPAGPKSPETNLLVQMQGMFAEYEREKILERSRRGRRHNARQGRVSVLGHAPYGYRYIDKRDGDGEARYDVFLEEARVVQELFRWIGLESLSLRAAAARLKEQQIPTRTGKAHWDAATIRGILRNQAYYGQAHWGKTRMEMRTRSHRPYRGQPDQPRREKVAKRTPDSEHEIISVPALISKDLFDAVTHRLADNRQHQRGGTSFLLSGLLMCQQCGSAYCGRRHRSGKHRLAYYRCLGTDKYRHGGEKLCDNAAVPGAVEDEIWNDVCALVRDPERLREQLQRREKASSSATAKPESSRRLVAELKRQLARLMDMYENGYMEKAVFETRAGRVRERLRAEEKAYSEQTKSQQRADEGAALLANFEQFANEVKTSLSDANFAIKQQIMKLLIQRIEVREDQIHIVYKVQPRPFAPEPEKGNLQHRLKLRVTASR